MNTDTVPHTAGETHAVENVEENITPTLVKAQLYTAHNVKVSMRLGTLSALHELLNESG